MTQRTADELKALLLKGGLKRAERRRLGVPDPDTDALLIERLERENKLLKDIIKEFLGWDDAAIDGAVSPEIE